jgi:hypothetical protein
MVRRSIKVAESWEQGHGKQSLPLLKRVPAPGIGIGDDGEGGVVTATNSRCEWNPRRSQALSGLDQTTQGSAEHCPTMLVLCFVLCLLMVVNDMSGHIHAKSGPCIPQATCRSCSAQAWPSSLEVSQRVAKKSSPSIVGGLYLYHAV